MGEYYISKLYIISNLIKRGVSGLAKILRDCEGMTKEDWLLQRRQGIGGSDIGAICGVNKWKNALDIYLDKVADNDTKEKEQNEFAYWGTVLEDVVAEEFEKRTGKKVLQYNYMYQHEEYPFLIANIDREIVGENAGLECKTASEFKSEEWENGIPESYELQCHHYMAVMGFDKMYIACLCGGNKFFIREIMRDEAIIANIIELATDFWQNHVVTKIPPMIGSSESLTNETLLKVYPEADPYTTTDLDMFAEFDLRELDNLKKTKKEIEKKIDTIETSIKQKIGTYESARAGGYYITWKNSTRSTFDSKRFKAECPEMAQMFIKESKTRILNIKKVGE